MSSVYPLSRPRIRARAAAMPAGNVRFVMLAPGDGIVTLMFTDIEGSTRLAREYGDRWAEVLARHHRILEESIKAHGGDVDGTEGDAFFAIFSSARDCVAAATEIQRRLAAEDWPGQPVKVRIGLHTGEVRRTATQFVGIEIHRAARVAASAHGGQVLLTQPARDIAGVGDVTEDLGHHRLKDFPEPERLFHLVVDGRTADQFPPPKTLVVRPTNVPVIDTPLIGRRRELAEVHDHLADGTRLLTLTGLGGAGKTRLAVAAAEELLDDFPGGTWFVPLADVTAPERMLAVVADNLRLSDETGRSALEVIAERLRADSTLLVLDNLEQLRDASTVITDLLSAAPTLKVLATSQAPLRLSAEHVMPLDALPVDEGHDLFVEIASRRRHGFDPAASKQTIDLICQRLDGLPLAIELAAARSSLLSPEELLDGLVRSLELLRVRDADRPERHRSLRAAIDWTFDLLAPEARDLFADLSLFVTPFNLSDVNSLGAPFDELEELFDFGFLQRVETGTGETRFTMAQTLREFAHERLVENESLSSASRRHAEWALALAEAAAMRQAQGDVAESQKLSRRLDDFYAALAWSRENEPELHLALCGALPEALIWIPAGTELDAELSSAAERETTPSRDLARTLTALGAIKNHRGEVENAITLLERGVATWRAIGEQHGLIDGLNALAHAALDSTSTVAQPLAEEAMTIAHALGDTVLIERSTMTLAQVLVANGDIGRAEPLIERALPTASDGDAATGLRHLYADCALIRRDGTQAAVRYGAAIRALPALDESPQVAVELEGLAMSLACAGHATLALEVDRIAAAHAEHFNSSVQSAFWVELREQNLEPARAANPTYAPSCPLDDLAAAREWALAAADDAIISA